ncbi:DUF4160 domain-containing protein [Xanthobacter sp.]|uniref:DUF4160 domain-containing protein n=1 Tax=Xanthobacter sp. TaxID=35809 RepID=UPI0035B07754
MPPPNGNENADRGHRGGRDHPVLLQRSSASAFHARFAEHQALIALNSWDVLEGSLPAPKLRAVLDWAKAHEDELVTCWKKAVVRQSPGKIG